MLNAETGDVLAVVSDRRKINSGTGRVDQFSQRATPATIRSDVQRWAASTARKLRSELYKAMKP